MRTWKKFLSMICKNNKLELEQKLGEWTKKKIRQKANQQYYSNATCSRVFFKGHDGRWESFDTEDRRRYKILINKSLLGREPPTTDLIPIDVEHKADQIIAHIMKRVENKETHETPHTWEKYLMATPEWERELLKNSIIHIGCETLVKHLLDESGTITIVSDGGLKDGVSSYGWAMAKETKAVIASGHGVAHGGPKSSHRSECFGKLAWIVFLKRFIEFHHIRVYCTIESFCDNKTVIEQTDKGTQFERTSDALMANYDIIKEIHSQQEDLMETIETYLHGRHVKGHQDTKKKVCQLSLQEWLNVQADQLASQAIVGDSTEIAFFTPSCKAYLVNRGEIQGSKERSTTLWKWSELQLQDYYMEKMKLNQKQLHGIVWDSVKAARNKMDQSMKTFAIKFGIGWLATGTRLEQQGHNIKRCVRCKEDESNEHIFKCNAKRSDIIDRVMNFDEYMASLDTKAEIKDTITFGIKQWIEGTRTDKKISDVCKTAYEHQIMIGWEFFVRGFISRKWTEVQDTHYRMMESKRTGVSWGAKIITWWTAEAKEIWQERNNEIHEKKPGSESRDEEEAIEQARLLYSQEMEMCEQDREIFNKSIDTKLKQNWRSLSEWVANIRPMVKRSVQQLTEKIQRGQADIRIFTSNNQNEIQQDNNNQHQGRIALDNTSGTTHLV
jgi:hypothetical protein